MTFEKVFLWFITSTLHVCLSIHSWFLNDQRTFCFSSALKDLFVFNEDLETMYLAALEAKMRRAKLIFAFLIHPIPLNQRLLPLR